MTDTTTARRQLLALLLDRVDRDALLPAERPLLRACVTAEQGAADDQPTPDDVRPWIADALSLDIEASWGVIADAARTHLHHLATTNDAIARVRELAERWRYVTGLKDSPRTSLLRALDGPSPTPDDTPSPVKSRCDCPPTNAGLTLCADCPGRTDDASDVEIVAANDIPTDWARGTELRCPARYTGPPPGIDVKWGARSDYRCDLRVHGRGTDHAVQLGHGPFAWTDDIAVWPTDDATPRQCRRCGCPAGRGCFHCNACDVPDAPSMTVDQAVDVLADDIARRAVEGGNTGQIIGLVGLGIATSEGVFCSPLVNADCPGHTAPPYCERAASSLAVMATPPDWEQLAEQQPAVLAADTPPPQCNATITRPDQVTRCALDAGHYDSADQPAPLAEPPTTGGWHVSDDGERVWCDEANGATPHHDAPSEPQS